MPWSTTRISPYGDVFPCLNYRIGNVRDHSLLRLWNNRAYQKFRKIFKARELVPSCVGCCKMIKKTPASG
ncbi:MAG: SPASM domain-containing protein [Nitrospinota bacterium]